MIEQGPGGLLVEVFEGVVSVDDEIVDEYGPTLTIAKEEVWTTGAIIDRRFAGKRVRVTIEELPEEVSNDG